MGQKLARALLSLDSIESIVLADVSPLAPGFAPERVQGVQFELADAAAVESLVKGKDMIFHLAAVVSGQAEANFDLGMRVNVDGTRNLLEAARREGRRPVVVFTSSLAVFGPPLPQVITDETAVHPRSSYGTQKAIGELLVSDFSRKGYIDGRVVRLPTVCVRPGAPNAAASSFVSGIIREPLNGQTAVCPVDPGLELWLSSPSSAVANLVRAALLPETSLGEQRVINVPGITVSVAQMCDALRRIGGAPALERIVFRDDPAIRRIVASWPSRFDVARAVRLGFARDGSFDDLVLGYIADAGLQAR